MKGSPILRIFLIDVPVSYFYGQVSFGLKSQSRVETRNSQSKETLDLAAFLT